MSSNVQNKNQNDPGSHPDKEKVGKLDKTKQSDIKEKTYTARQVETSVTLLESPENDIVLEALLFLSKYSDINKNNVISLIKIATIEKLLNNFGKNICILRLSLRLISKLLDCEEGLNEIDQDKFDEGILNIASMYIDHKDTHVKEFCVEILAKIAQSCRIITLIFRIDLFNPIFENVKNSKNISVLFNTLLLFFELIESPAAVCALPDCPRYDLNIILVHLNNKEEKISNLSLDIVEKLSRHGLPFLQEGFKKHCLVEKMFKIIMNEIKTVQHLIAIEIIKNCLNAEETASYFVESVEFLELCQWMKTCHPKYILPLIDIFTTLTNIPEMKQIIYDLSIEETIMSFFRLKEKKVINKTCEAISNMTSHKYCCETMLTSVIADILMEILQRQNDEEDCYNELALKTVFLFIRRYIKALDMFLEKNIKPILLDYFYNKTELISEESFVMVFEILYRCIVHPKYQEEFVDEELLAKILQLLQSSVVEISKMSCELISNLASSKMFRKYFLTHKGPTIVLNVLKNTTDFQFLTEILYFIFSCSVYEDITMALLHNELINILKNFDSNIFEKIPICKKVTELALDFYPPIKFYEFGRIEITDKLPNKFYLINGPWKAAFPFLEILEIMKVSPYQTIYIVDYSYEVVKGAETELQSQTSLSSSESLLRSSSTNSSSGILSLASDEVPSAFDINYGQISKDIYLPRYIYHLKKFEKYTEGIMEERVRLLAEYVDTLLCGVKENQTLPQKIHEYKMHIECLKHKLGNNVIPVGYLRIGFHCERALLFKALADKICIPCSLVKGSLKVYWNEVALFERIDDQESQDCIKFYVVDLIHQVGNLMPVGSREANKYCNLN